MANLCKMCWFVLFLLLFVLFYVLILNAITYRTETACGEAFTFLQIS